MISTRLTVCSLPQFYSPRKLILSGRLRLVFGASEHLHQHIQSGQQHNTHHNEVRLGLDGCHQLLRGVKQLRIVAAHFVAKPSQHPAPHGRTRDGGNAELQEIIQNSLTALSNKGENKEVKTTGCADGIWTYVSAANSEFTSDDAASFMKTFEK